ncbi:MAG: anthranilate synthase component I [Kiritimatiellae bacterium]|nr:anthranilate synthase component I [Kiritimatiellia bacterium]
MYSPDKKTFIEKTAQGNLVPVWRELLADQETPVSVYERLRSLVRDDTLASYSFLFESVEGGEHIARFSFLGAQPQTLFKATDRNVKIESSDGSLRVLKDVEPLSTLRDFMSQYSPVSDPKLPRFFGGAVGYVGYDSIAQFDKVPLSAGHGLRWPDICFQITDTLIIFDRVLHTMKVVANAFIQGDPGQAYEDAIQRIDTICERLRVPVPDGLLDVRPAPEKTIFHAHTTPSEFIQGVDQVKEYIRAGDIFQAVLSQRFEVEESGNPFDAYRALRSINPSPYMFCIEFGERAMVGSSPEIHVRCEDQKVKVRPIAGTRPRTGNPEKDQKLVKELLADPKERAEHIMLVDLGRNDIGRVCKFGSVNVAELMVVEQYSHVMHIVSDVTGDLDPAYDIYDVMCATFPAGTLTGAPKIRAMEIIAELEKTRRGPYGGAVGYFSFNGNLDSCIAIRTILIEKDKSYVQAGAGIVADSDPQREYEETCNKAKGMLNALALSCRYAQIREGKKA